MDENSDYRFVLLDAVEGLRAKAEANSGTGLYDQGRQMAYYEILESILQSAEIAGLTAADVGLAGFDAGRLVGLKSSKAA